MLKFAALVIAILFNFLLLATPTYAQTDFESLWNDIVTNNKAYQLLLSKKSPSPTPRNSATPTPTPAKNTTPKPSATPTPTPSPTSRPSTTPNATSTPTSSHQQIQDYLMAAINNYRKSNGLPSVETDSNTCGFATTRAKEIVGNFNHSGFEKRIASHTIPYPDYHLITENIAMTSNYKNVVNLWIKSAGHAKNMREDTPFVCVEFSGNYYAYEGWKP